MQLCRRRALGSTQLGICDGAHQVYHRHHVRSICCHSAKSGANVTINVSTQARSQRHPKKGTNPPKDKGEDSSDEDSDSEITITELNVDPVSVSVVEAQLTALFAMVVAGGVGSLVNVDPWSYYIPDGNAVALSVVATLPLIVAGAALAFFPTGVFPNPTKQQRDVLSECEDESVLGNRLSLDIDLGTTLLPAAAKVHLVDGPRPKTKQPFLSGLRLFQLFATKPWFPEFNRTQLAAITASSAMQLTASELLARGLAVALIANWVRDSVAAADQTSILFWTKLFHLNNADTYRWIGTWVIATVSLWAVDQEAKRVRQFSRLALERLRHPVPLETDSNPTATTISTTTQQDATQPALSARAAAAGNSSECPATASVTIVDSISAAVSTSTSGGASSSGDSSGGQSTAVGSAAVGQHQLGGSVSPSFEYLDPSTYDPSEDKFALIQTDQGIKVSLGEVPGVSVLPTEEELVARNIAIVVGTAQIVLLAILFGSTGTLVAPLTSRLLHEIAGNAVVRYHAKGGPVSAGDPIWLSGQGRQPKTAPGSAKD